MTDAIRLMHTPEDDYFFASVLDSLSEQITVVDNQGQIQWVNRAWKEFAEENGGLPEKTWQGVNYIRVCVNSASGGEQDHMQALNGIESVIEGKESDFYFEYPCHSPTEQRWFMMRICSLNTACSEFFVVSHHNITERKLAEIRVQEQALLDGLTGIANRRHFDDFLMTEWRRAHRDGQPMSVVLLDIDYFKPYNDNYGHVAGDDCLRRVGKVLKCFARRPGDLVARYGGEEFAVILGGTEKKAACDLAERICSEIRALKIPHEFATQAGYITVSVGVATRRPDTQTLTSPFALVDIADKALYRAKGKGRNRVCVDDDAIPQDLSSAVRNSAVNRSLGPPSKPHLPKRHRATWKARPSVPGSTASVFPK